MLQGPRGSFPVVKVLRFCFQRKERGYGLTKFADFSHRDFPNSCNPFLIVVSQGGRKKRPRRKPSTLPLAGSVQKFPGIRFCRKHSWETLGNQNGMFGLSVLQHLVVASSLVQKCFSSLANIPNPSQWAWVQLPASSSFDLSLLNPLVN